MQDLKSVLSSTLKKNVRPWNACWQLTILTLTERELGFGSDVWVVSFLIYASGNKKKELKKKYQSKICEISTTTISHR